MNSLVSVLQDLKENERRKIKAEEMITKTLTETTCGMQRLTGAVFRLEEMIKTGRIISAYFPNFDMF